MKTKADIRTVYKKKRQNLSALQIEELSIAIANQALQLNIWQHTYYHLFLSIARHKEVETDMLLHALQGKDKQVVISKTNFKTHSLSHYLLTDATAIKENAWGIPEPQEGLEVPVNKIDVVFVPLLAYDQSGHRVGYGKGFYDRFLHQCRDNTLKIGLSFFEALETKLVTNTHDVPLDGVITPEEHYWF